MAFELPDLPYDYKALEKHGMSAETLKLHHDFHHKAYVDNGNKLIEGTEWDSEPLEDIIRNNYDSTTSIQNGIFNNLSQFWNHNQFWEMMGPTGRDMPFELEAAILDSFKTIEDFKQAFITAGVGQFGAGWCWLVKKPDDSLAITKTANGVNPLCFNQIVLLGCDVWEHAYYLDYRNKRPDYIRNFLDNLVNWENVAMRLEDS